MLVQHVIILHSLTAKSILTISEKDSGNKPYVLVVWLEENPITGEVGATIDVQGILKFSKTGGSPPENPSTLANFNFYETAGAGVSSNDQTGVTFIWNANAGGTGVAGWLKEAAD